MSTILVVDDDPDFVDSTRALLEAHGYSVVSAHNGRDARTAAERHKPDLMLLDVMMTHDTEGFETVGLLKKDAGTRNIPIIIISGIRKAKTLPFRYEPDEDWLPVQAVLEKPVVPESLLKAVETALGTQQNKSR